MLFAMVLSFCLFCKLLFRNQAKVLRADYLFMVACAALGKFSCKVQEYSNRSMTECALAGHGGALEAGAGLAAHAADDAVRDRAVRGLLQPVEPQPAHAEPHPGERAGTHALACSEAGSIVSTCRFTLQCASTKLQ